MSRRCFLGGVAASTTVFLVPPHQQAGAAPVDTLEGETKHFWYRLAPTHPYVDSQRENKAFGFGEGRIFLSEDNGQTWPHIASFPNANNITFSCILRSGNILFATRTRLYLSTDNLKSYQPITVKDQEGRDYLPHSPQDPSRPGWYFHPLDGVHTWDVDGSEMLGVGELLQRPRWSRSDKYLLFIGPRENRKDRLFFRTQSEFS